MVTETSADAIVSIDDHSIIRFANPATEEIFGCPIESLIGQSLTTLMPDSMRERHLAAVGRYLESGTPAMSWHAVELTGPPGDRRGVPDRGVVRRVQDRWAQDVHRDDPRYQPAQGTRVAARRGPADGGGRPDGRRDRPRLQQHPDRGVGLRNAAQGRAAAERPGPERRRRDPARGIGRHGADAPAARVQPSPGASSAGRRPGRHDRRNHADDRAPDRREHLGRVAPPGLPDPPDRSRSDAARPGRAQPRTQRPRRDAGRRDDHDRDRRCRARSGLRADTFRGRARSVCPAGGERHGQSGWTARR